MTLDRRGCTAEISLLMQSCCDHQLINPLTTTPRVRESIAQAISTSSIPPTSQATSNPYSLRELALPRSSYFVSPVLKGDNTNPLFCP